MIPEHQYKTIKTIKYKYISPLSLSPKMENFYSSLTLHILQ